MALIMLDDKVELMVESGLQGATLQQLYEIGDVARRLQWSASYNTQTRAITLSRGFTESTGRIFADNAEAMAAVLDTLRFAWRAQYNNVPHELLSEIEQMQADNEQMRARIEALEHQRPAGEAAKTCLPPEPVVAHGNVTLLPIAAGRQRPGCKQTEAERSLQQQIDELAKDAANIDGIVLYFGGRASYLRSGHLAKERPLLPHQEHDGVRYFFEMPHELEAMRRFIWHDRNLLHERVQAQTG